MTSADARRLAPLLLSLAACGGGSSAPPAGQAGPPPNVLPVSVDGAGCSAGSYLNKPCVSVTVCEPRTSTCQTIGDLLLDTGSVGLRVFSQVLTLHLPPVSSGGGSLAECVGYLDGSAHWGPVVLASVALGSEPAVEIPVQVIDATYASPPAACQAAEASPAAAGFNGILGVGTFEQDCGPGCTVTSNGMYYACGAASCAPAAVALASQLQNPVAALPVDNNGLVIRLPGVAAAGASAVEGEVLLGIGTRSNNVPPGSAVALPLDASGEFRTTLGGATVTAFLDTGSNGLFFAAPPGAGLAACAAPDAAWYCPASTVTVDTSSSGATGGPAAAVPVQVGNFLALTAPASVNVCGLVAGPVGPASSFDWGLPFHLGRDVYLGLEGRRSSLGAGPLVAW